MKIELVLLSAVLTFPGALAESLPYVATHPQSTVVAPGSDVTFSIVSTNATAYQWRFNGTNLAWGTASSLVVTNAQTNNTGYYVAIARNSAGWTPSQLAYLSVVWTNGTVPRYNTNIPSAQAFYADGPSCVPYYGNPISSGSAQVYAGPALDAMFPAGSPRPVTDGYFGPTSAFALAPGVAPGETAFYRVDISYSYLPSCSGTYTQRSTILRLTAGGGGFPTPMPASLQFPNYVEWPEDGRGIVYKICMVPGETIRFDGAYLSFAYCPTQWRKDGVLIPNATNVICTNWGTPPFGSPVKRAFMPLAITNAQPSDAGNYDFLLDGNGSALSYQIRLSVALTNGQGVLRNPRVMGSNFLCEFEGAPTRKYTIHSSTNLVDWVNAGTLTGTNGPVMFTNSLTVGSLFYRTILQPLTLY